MNASDLAPSYDVVVIGGGPAGLAAASLGARAGVSTVLFDENPGVGGQIYRGITSTPITNRGVLGEEYWAGAALAAEAKAKMEDFVARRTKTAEGKIALAEAQALADVRAAAAEAAVQAASTILSQSVKGQVADDLLAKGITEVRQKLN